MKKNNFLPTLAFLAGISLLSSSCVSDNTLKGIASNGEKVYLGAVPIGNTKAYQIFRSTSGSETDKANYIIRRFTEAEDLWFHKDGGRHNWTESYRGGMWLLKNRFREGDDARKFIHEHVRYSESTGKPYHIEYPDGSVHVGYYVLLNELDLLEETIRQKRAV